MPLRVLLSAFAITALAELPDKTALAAVFLATRRNPWAVFVGAAGAFLVQTAIAVALGHALGRLPARPVRLGAGLLFLALAAAMLLRREADEQKEAAQRSAAGGFHGSAAAAFAVIFVAEWGDLTQFSTAALAARYQSPWLVFAGATLGLWAVCAAAVAAGSRAKATLRPEVLQKLAAGAFALAGLAMLAEGLRA